MLFWVFDILYIYYTDGVERIRFHLSCAFFRSEIVSCLSEFVRDDILKEDKHRVSLMCRKQLRVEVLTRVGYSYLSDNVSPLHFFLISELLKQRWI